MAIDTANKRRSIAGYTGTLCYPIPDGAISALADRVHNIGLYAGTAVTTVLSLRYFFTDAGSGPSHLFTDAGSGPAHQFFDAGSGPAFTFRLVE